MPDPTISTTPRPAQRPSFGYLDGMRGLAALAVALLHAYLYTGRTGDARSEMPILGLTIGQGYLGVAVFIVLSGYVLMLPVVSRPDLRFSRGTVDFLKRRARRILPPYFGALLISLALIALVPILQSPQGTQWDTKLPVTPAGTISHLLLVHNLSPDWYGKINGPLWSVALEWQIYFLMPLVLLPLWRRFAPFWIVPGLAVVTLLPVAFGYGAYLHPQLLVLFAGGMLAAQLTMGTQRLDRRAFWCLSGLGLISAAVLSVMVWRSTLSAGWLTDLWAGALTCTVLVWFGRRALAGRPVPLSRLLATKPFMFLGLISYSVYLMHSPLLGLGNLLMLDLEITIVQRYLLMTFVVLPLSLVACAGFYWLVERNFKNSRQRQIVEEIRDDAAHGPLDQADGQVSDQSRHASEGTRS